MRRLKVLFVFILLFISANSFASFGDVCLIDVSAGPGGTITPSGTINLSSTRSSPNPASPTLSIVPSPGYRIKDVKEDGQSVMLWVKSSAGEAASYNAYGCKYAGPERHVIYVTFEPKPKELARINATTNTGGTISPGGIINIDEGGGQLFTFSPYNGYRIKEILVNNAPITPDTPGSHKVKNIRGANNTLRAVFEPRCNYSINPESQSFGPDGGDSDNSIRTFEAGCNWSAVSSSSASWISFPSGRTGVGSKLLPYRVAANPNVSPRTATFTIGDNISRKVFTVNQAACTYSVSPSSKLFNQSGGTGTFNITTSGAGCRWTITDSVNTGYPWISFSSGRSGTGSSTVTYTVAPSTTQRRAVFYIQGQAFTVIQGRTI